MADENFKEAVIFITEYNQNGAMGFVINKPFPRKFNELSEFAFSQPHALFQGGPVETDKLFFIHQQPNLIEGGALISNPIYLGGNFAQAVQLLDANVIDSKKIKLFIGYCGWNSGELEAEIEEGSWQIIKLDFSTVFEK